MSIELRTLSTETASNNLTMHLKGSPLTNAEVDQNFINLNLLKANVDGTIAITGNQTFESGITLINGPTINLTNSEILTIGDNSNTIEILGELSVDTLTLINPVSIDVVGDCSLNTIESFDGNSSITLDISVDVFDGNAGSATKLNTARNFSISGDITAAAMSFDGTSNINLDTTLVDEAVTPDKIASTGTFNFPVISVGSGATISNIIKVVAEVIIPPSIADTELITVTVAGATFDSSVVAQPAEAFTDSIGFNAYVSDVDEVTLLITNTDTYPTVGQTLNFTFLIIK